MQKVSLPLTISLMIAAFVIGTGTGYWLTPEYRMTMYDKSVMDMNTSDKWTDLRYIDDMIAHHREAILLAEEATASRRPEILKLRSDILKNEPAVIEQLKKWKTQWFDNSKIGQDPQVVHLGAYNHTFDLRFLNALIAHHERGIQIARTIRMKSDRSEILDNADEIERSLQENLALLRVWRKSWYNTADMSPCP